MRTKSKEWWGIKYPADWNCSIGIRPFECRRTKREAINNFCSDYADTWVALRRKGFSCVKVQIVEVKP